MGRLIYSMNVSLDGYVETLDHSLEWTTMDEEIHGWWNDRVRESEAFLYGRRLYETMAAHWPTAAADPTITPVELDFATIWNARPKIVFSTTLSSVVANSRLVRGPDGGPADVTEELARLRTEFDGDLDVGGPTLASAFVRQGLVDEYRLLVHPVALGAGTPFFPALESPLRLRLVDTRRFASGAVLLAYVPA